MFLSLLLELYNISKTKENKITNNISMHSQRQFTPGKKSNSIRSINYVAAYNAAFPNSSQSACFCIPDKYNKTVLGSDSPSTKISNNRRISQIINYSRGGNIQYGNSYLGQPLNINSLGRAEGMPGGSGKPPTNRF
jgi:hypothetical protein